MWTSTFTIALLGLAGSASAFSPMPRQLRSMRATSKAEAGDWNDPAAAPAPAPPSQTMTGNEPPDWVGMPSPDNYNLQKMAPSEAAEQAAAMDKLAKEWRFNRLDREYEESKLLGWRTQAEIINGRSAMFFIVVGLLTEAFSGQSIPEQVLTMLETFDIIDLS